jgi:uncharacterized protein YndB with AHSA1/START domain
MPSVTIDVTLEIGAPAVQVFDAFFDEGWLGRWWQVDRAIVAPRLLAPFAVSWPTTSFRDPVLGPLGGIFHGVVIDLRRPREAFIGECYWVPPEGDALGPMALTITCTPAGDLTQLRVVQSGFENAPRWRRYYEVTNAGMRSCLEQLGRLLEQ